MITGNASLTIIITPSRDQFRWTEWPKRETVTKLIVVLLCLNVQNIGPKVRMNSTKLKLVLLRLMCCCFDLFIQVNSDVLLVFGHQVVQAKETCLNVSCLSSWTAIAVKYLPIRSEHFFIYCAVSAFI